MSDVPTDLDELDQLAEAFLTRLRNDERPALSEYTDKYPALAERIRELFPALAALERFGAVVGADDDAPVKSTAPAKLGEYKIVREIGRGGMGIVYEAMQESLGRHVALKVLTGASPNAVARFRREARIAARLHHTNIVPVFGVGSEGGTLFYAMQFIVGQGMNDVIAEVRRHRANETPMVAPDADTESAGSASRLIGPHADVFFRNVARLMAQAADGLTYAHEHGVLHRDLKPSNMLLDAQGTLWIADFGLARGRDEDDLTNTGDLIGTLRYMAPECFSGPGDMRSDVYSLGATFYEVLTQKPAFVESDRPRLIEQVLNSSPRSLHYAAPGIPADLHTIVQKAMAKSPADRYQSAAELGEDLRRFLEGRPILARRLSIVEQARRWARRNPLAAGLTAMVLVVALLGAGISGLFAWRAHERANREHEANEEKNRHLIDAQTEKARAEAEKARAEAETLRSEWLAHAGLMTSAQDELLEFNADRAWTHLDNIRWDFRGLEFHLLHNIFWLNRRDLFGHDKYINAVAFFPDGEHLVTGSDDKKLACWDLRKRQFDTWPAHEAPVTAVAVTPDGSRIVSASAGGELAVWDAKTRQQIRAIPAHSGDRIRSVAMSPDGANVATAGDDDTVRLWKVPTLELVWDFNAKETPARAVAFHPKGRLLAAAGEKGRVVVLNIETRKPEKTLTGPACELRGVAYSADGKWLATANANRTVSLWKTNTGELVRTIGGHSDKVNAVAFSPTQPHLLSVAEDNSVRMWNYDTGQPVRMYYGHGHAVLGVAFAPDGRHFATCGQGSSAYLWDSSIGQEPLALRENDRPIRDVALAPDGILLAEGGEDNVARLWNAETGELIKRLVGHTDSINSVAFSPDQRWLATGSNDNTVRIWDVRGGTEPRVLKHAAHVQRVVFHPRRPLLASSDNIGEVIWWDLETAAPVEKFRHSVSAPGLAFSPDGARFASSDQDGTILIREVASPQKVKTLRHTQAVITLDFDATGGRLAAGSWDATGQVFDISSDRVLPLRGHTQSLAVIAFAGDRLISAGYDRTIKIWNGENGQNLLTLRDRGGPVRGLSYSAKGHRLAAACSDGSVKIWDTTPRDNCRSLKGHTAHVVAAAYGRGGKLLVTGAHDGTRVWNAETGRLIANRHAASEGLTATAVGPDDRTFATGYADGRVAVFDARSGSALQALQGPAVSVRSLAFRDANHVAAAFDDGQVMVWNVTTHDNVLRRKLAESPRHVALSADGSRFASVDAQGTVTLCEVTSGAKLHSFDGLGAAGDAVVVSADGSRVAASTGRDVILWDATGQRIAQFRAAEPMSLLSLNANGHFVAGGSGTPAVEVWDLDRDKHVRITSGHSGAVRALALSPDGRRVATTSVDTVAKVTNWEDRAAREQAELARP